MRCIGGKLSIAYLSSLQRLNFVVIIKKGKRCIDFAQTILITVITELFVQRHQQTLPKRLPRPRGFFSNFCNQVITVPPTSNPK